MVKADPCPKCGYTRFSSHYFGERPGLGFWWLKIPAKPERIELWCLRCNYEWSRPDLVGTVLQEASIQELMSG